MPCFKPVTAYQPPDGGRLVFQELKDHREIQFPCRKCIGCRLDHQSSWALRCQAEAALHRVNLFITLTYADEHLPSLHSLSKRDVQLFLKRVRKAGYKFRYFCAGEYGEQLGRPHYHLLAFGLDLPDLVRINSVHARHALYESKLLTGHWGKGNVVIGGVSYESARYAAGYCLKKITGPLAEDHYTYLDPRTGELGQREPEFSLMSRHPGLGTEWFRKFAPELFVHAAAVQKGGYKVRLPEFARGILEGVDADAYEGLVARLTEEAKKCDSNRTRERLAVREASAKAKIQFQKERKSNAL